MPTVVRVFDMFDRDADIFILVPEGMSTESAMTLIEKAVRDVKGEDVEAYNVGDLDEALTETGLKVVQVANSSVEF